MPRAVTVRRTILTAASALAALALTAPPASATSTPAQIAASKANGTAYLTTLQRPDGSYAGAGLSTEWAFSAFAAAGTAAADVAPGGDTSRNARSAYRALLSQAGWPSPAPAVSDYERALLNAYAAGIDPARVSASRNLVADVYGYWQPLEAGYFGPPADLSGTVFAALALGGAHTRSGHRRAPEALLDAIATRIRANQHDDGGWNYGRAEGDPGRLGTASDVDMTGAAMAALCVSGVPRTDTAVLRARDFLAGRLVAASGAFGAMFGPNTDSNGWAVSGLNACGIDAQSGDFLTAAGRTPVDFLIGQQFSPGGGFRYRPADTAPAAYSSIDGLRAVAGGGFTTAPPAPVTPGAPRWVGRRAFTTGTDARLALTVDDGTGRLEVCSVVITPTGRRATLGAVLDAATAAAVPSGCVTGAVPASGTGRLTALNGTASNGSGTWKASIDGSPFTAARRGRAIDVGDTIALRWGS